MKHLKNEDGVVVLHELLASIEPEAERSEDDLVIMFLDVETTSLDPKTGEIIQLAVLPILVSRNEKKVTCIKAPIVQFNEPSEPITKEIQDITGITDEDVRGKRINWEKVSNLLSKADLIIAHNAKFDYSWVKSTFLKNSINLPDVPWACSMDMINWRSLCKASKSLEVLCAWSGFFYPSHDAKFDVIALCHLLTINNKMKELVEIGMSNSWRIFVIGMQQNENAFLKSRNYWWDPQSKSWFKNFLTEDEADQEMTWVAEFNKWSNPKNIKSIKAEISCLQRFD